MCPVKLESIFSKASTLLAFEYLPLTVHNSILYMARKEGQFDVVELMVNKQLKNFRINLNAQQ